MEIVVCDVSLGYSSSTTSLRSPSPLQSIPMETILDFRVVPDDFCDAG